MTPEYIIILLADIIVAAALFLFVPVVIRIKAGRISRGKAKAVCIINAILVEALSTAVFIWAGAPNYNFTPAVIWGLVSYHLLRDKYS